MEHETYWEDQEEGGGDIDTIMDLQSFGDDENWIGSMVGGQPNNLDFGLSEAIEASDLGGRHLDIQGIQHGLYEVGEEKHELDDFWTTTIMPESQFT